MLGSKRRISQRVVVSLSPALCENCEHLIGEIKERGKKRSNFRTNFGSFLSLFTLANTRPREIRGRCETVERARVLAGDVFRASFCLETSTGQRQSAKLLGRISHRSTEFEHTRAEICADKHTPRCLFSAIETKARERAERTSSSVFLSRGRAFVWRKERERETSSREKFLAPPFLFLARYEEKEEASGNDDQQNDNDTFASTPPSRLSLRARV